ncbi:hypothetical protein MRX96_009941 [Rhipicephalus microplus]
MHRKLLARVHTRPPSHVASPSEDGQHLRDGAVPICCSRSLGKQGHPSPMLGVTPAGRECGRLCRRAGTAHEAGRAGDDAACLARGGNTIIAVASHRPAIVSAALDDCQEGRKDGKTTLEMRSCGFRA